MGVLLSAYHRAGVVKLEGVHPMLSDSMVVPTIPVTDLDRARAYYVDVLGPGFRSSRSRWYLWACSRPGTLGGGG